MTWNPDDPFPASAALGETDSGARNLPAYLCSFLEPGPVLVFGASEVLLTAAAEHEVTVFDWNSRRLAALQRFARERGIDVRVVCGDPERQELGIGARTFSNVVCLDVLERFRNDVLVLDKLRRVLRPEGKLVARVRACAWIREEGRMATPPRCYDAETLRRSLEEAGFRTLRLRHWNFVGVPGAFLWDRCLGRSHRDSEGLPSAERPRRWWDGGMDAWFRIVENRVGFPVGVSLVTVATPYLEKVRVRREERSRGFTGKTAREAYEPMAASR